MKAYTYSIKHLPTKRIYYGVRKSSTNDIGTKYFSSSKLIKRMILSEPMENFEFKIRKSFQSYREARIYETKLLQKIKAVSNPMVLNQAISSPTVPAKDSISETKRRAAISKRMKELWNTDEYKNNQSFNKVPKEELSIRGKIGNQKRTDNYSSGKTKRKDKKKPVYKDIIITKNNISKIIKANQFAAYAKYGWTRSL